MSRLILVPTQMELDIIEPLLRPHAAENWNIQLCGFGVIAAASRSASLIEQLNPLHVLLLGIAGTFDDQYPVGSAAIFGEVRCWGIGVGSGTNYRGADDVGFQQWDGETKIGESIKLTGSTDNVLISCCAASADATERQQRKVAMSAALAEDMEGFGVALSCKLAGVPLTIVRGISNQVGDRDQDRWQIAPALQAAATLAIEEVISKP